MSETADLTIASFRYRNHRGEEAVRTVRPVRIWFGCTAYHREAGWFLEAFCLDRQETRDFSMSNILGDWARSADAKVN